MPLWRVLGTFPKLSGRKELSVSHPVCTAVLCERIMKASPTKCSTPRLVCLREYPLLQTHPRRSPLKVKRNAIFIFFILQKTLATDAVQKTNVDSRAMICSDVINHRRTFELTMVSPKGKDSCERECHSSFNLTFVTGEGTAKTFSG